MEIRHINWDRYVTPFHQSNIDEMELHMDIEINPIIHNLHVEDNKIIYNKGMEAHLLLLNLAKISPRKFLKIAVLYELSSIFLEYRYLDAASLIMHKLQEEIYVLSDVPKFISEPIDLDFQFEFFLGHEKSHRLYEKESFLNEEAREKLNEIIGIYYKPQNLIQMFFFPKIRKMFKSESFIEEMCCDRNSVVYFIREIPKTKTVESIRQLSPLLYMLQLHKDLEDLIGFSLSKGLSKHLSRFYFDIIRGANIVQAIVDKCNQITADSQMDRTVVNSLVQENAYFYNHINNALLSLWKSDTDIFESINGNRTNFKNHKKYESLTCKFMEISEEIVR